MSGSIDEKIIQAAGGKISKPEKALAEVEAYLTQATPGLREGLSNTVSMIVKQDDIEVEELNKKEAAADLARARTARDEIQAQRSTSTAEGAETRARRGQDGEVDAAAVERAEERVQRSIAAYTTASKALDTAERRRDSRFNTAQSEREKGLAEMQRRFTTKALQVLLPGHTIGLAFMATPDGSHVTPGAAVQALRNYIKEKPVVSMREQAASTLRIMDNLAKSLKNGTALQGWKQMIAQLASETHTRGAAVPAFTGQAVGRLICETLSTALTPMLGGGCRVIVMMEKRVGSGKGESVPHLGHAELMDFLRSPELTLEITDTVDKVLTKEEPAAGGQANRATGGQGMPVCLDMKHKKTCEFGDKCKFSHDI